MYDSSYITLASMDVPYPGVHDIDKTCLEMMMTRTGKAIFICRCGVADNGNWAMCGREVGSAATVAAIILPRSPDLP